MTEKFFHDLLHYPGEDPATHLSQHLKYLDLRSDYDFFHVLILETEPDPAKSELDFTQYQIQLLNILDLVKEKMEIFDHVFYLKEFSGIVCIIGQNTKHPQHFLQSIHKVASNIVESCKNNVLSLNIGIGSLADSIWKLPVSFASASHSLKYRFFFPHKNIFDAREALGKEFSLLSFSENTDEELIRLICSKDMTAIEEWLTCYFQNLLGQVQDKNLVFIQIYSLLGRILKFLYEMNLDTRDLEREIIQVYTRFDSFRTYEQFVKWMTQLCASVCEKMDSSLQNYHNQIYTMALGYIRENFETNTLCLNDIARHANISPAYLSSMFKKVSGQSISDTITALRIESACHYLESTSLSLKEISTKCGYTNQYYFSNSFKKKLGMSPLLLIGKREARRGSDFVQARTLAPCSCPIRAYYRLWSLKTHRMFRQPQRHLPTKPLELSDHPEHSHYSLQPDEQQPLHLQISPVKSPVSVLLPAPPCIHKRTCWQDVPIFQSHQSPCSYGILQDG